MEVRKDEKALMFTGLLLVQGSGAEMFCIPTASGPVRMKKMVLT